MKNGYLGERDVRLAGSRFPSSDRGAGGEWAAAGRDEQIGKIFRNMRTALKISRDALARRLATSPEVIDSFEAGAVSALPHWKETERIVRSQSGSPRWADSSRSASRVSTGAVSTSEGTSI